MSHDAETTAIPTAAAEYEPASARIGSRGGEERRIVQFVRRYPGAGAALGFLFCIGLVAAVPRLFRIPDPLETRPSDAFRGPSRAHLFGTDDLGRDLFGRTIYGARVSLGTAVVVVALAVGIGVFAGLVAGYREGVVDALIGRLIDLILAFPAILLAMGLIAVLGQGWFNGALSVTIVSVPAFARLTRASVLSQKRLEYVLAAETMGASPSRIMLRTILPNCLGPILIQAAFVATSAILLEAALSFLGLGVKPPTASWGEMLSSGKTYLYRAWWFGFFPGLALAFVVLCFNTLGETAQRVADRR
jgi:ABC-type dipeptide/oligopeptide/nickel transport system permease subunit